MRWGWGGGCGGGVGGEGGGEGGGGGGDFSNSNLPPAVTPGNKPVAP